MDADSLKSLGTLLFWGALFFLMMRFGCGAHMMGGHGHGGHGGHGADAGDKDPVCGMDVDPAKAAGASVHGGRTHYFCSASCRDKFEKEPAKYATATARKEPGNGKHCHG